MPRAAGSARALAAFVATTTGLLGAPAVAYFGLQLRVMLYLFLLNTLPDRLPSLSSQNGAFLQSRNVHVLILLSDTGDEFAAYDVALRASPFVIRDVATSVLVSGSARLHVQVVQLS